MTRAKWSNGAWRDEIGRPVCVKCESPLSSHYTICTRCYTHLSRSQMDASDQWEKWNKERFERASAEPDEAKKRAILKEAYTVESKD